MVVILHIQLELSITYPNYEQVKIPMLPIFPSQPILDQVQFILWLAIACGAGIGKLDRFWTIVGGWWLKNVILIENRLFFGKWLEKLDQNWTISGPKLDQNWTISGPKLDQNWTVSGPLPGWLGNMGPERSVFRPVS